MDNAHLFLQNLTLVLGIAAITIAVCHWLKQPVVLGYLLAGMIIGPHVPLPIMADPEMVRTLAELGVILLMFSIGLEFRLHKLVQIAPTAGFIALLECSLMGWLGYTAGSLLGWAHQTSLFAGAIVAISSTTIIAKTFKEQNIPGKVTHISFGILIAEDLIAVLLLTLLSTFSSGRFSTALLMEKTGALTVFLIALTLAGLWIIPRLMKTIVRFNVPEISLVVSIGICFALASLAQSFGYSVALGAFIAGCLVAESGESHKIENLIQPVKDMFVAIFFVAIGMLIDPLLILHNWRIILLFTGIVMLGKIISVSMGTFLTGHSLPTSIRTGMSFAQIGEFSFIIAGIGSIKGHNQILYPLAVGVSAITTLTTPLFVRISERVALLVDRTLPIRLKTFVSLYGTWIHQVTQAKETPSFTEQIRKIFKLLLVDFILLTAVIVGMSMAFDGTIQFIQNISKLPPEFTKVLFYLAGVTLTLPFTIGIIGLSRKLGMTLALRALPKSLQGQIDLAHAPRRAFVVTLQLSILLVFGLLLLVLTQPFLPILYSSAFFGISLLVLGVVFWRHATELQGHVKAGAEMVVEALIPHSTREALPATQIQNLLPGLGPVTLFKIVPGNPVVGKTLAEINLSGKAGVSIISINRNKEGIVIPFGGEKLQANDMLALTGTLDAIEVAKELLS